MKEEDDENNKKINIPIISDIKEIFDKISSGNLAEIFNLKVFLKKILKNWKLLLLIGIVILVVLTGAYYWKTINDGTEDSESSSNVPNAVSSYTSSLTTGDSGELFDSSTIQDLWDELVENGSNIEDYLDSAEELMKLVNAELITQNVDTREDPDEEIDWDEVIEEMTYELGDSDEESSDDTEEEDEDEDLTSIQGIIKFKRATANDDGTDYDTETMSYVDYDTFYDWIEIYSEEGDTEVTYNGKKVSVVDCLETHFTLESEETSSSSSTSSDTSEESTEEISTATETYAVVATWNKVVHTETTNDSDREEEAEENSYISYTVSTTKVDYKELTSGYTMPFNYLWEFLVITKDKEFVMALADLVYESEIEITVYDTETINTNTETYNYDIERITITNVEELNYDYTGWISIPSYGRYDIYSGNFSIKKINGEAISKTSEVIDDKRYYYTTETITTTNTLNVELTKANVWMADYEVEISDVSTSENPQNSEAELDDKPIKDETYTSEDFEYGLSNIEEIKEEGSDSAYQIADDRVPDRIKITNDGSIEVDDEEDSSIASIFQNIIANILGTEYNVNVTTTLQEMSGITHIYTETYINRTLETYTNTETTKITLSPMTVTEKTDKNSIEDNFVTLFIAYQGARSSILELWNWLMEIMKANEDTVDLVDLTKYMVFMATGKDYGVTEFDFESLYESAYESLTSVSSGDFIVNTEMSDSSIVITDLETLKTAFSGYTTSAKLIEYAEYFLEYQEEYKVNAVFAAGVSIKETTAGTAGHATDGKNNWFNIICTCGNSSHGTYETYSSAQESIEAFFALIAKEGSESHYFGQGLYTVSEIGAVYCPNTPEYPTQADTWIEFVTEYMTKMYNAAGISILSSALEVADGTKAEKLSYLFPNGVPTSQSTMSTYMASVKVALTTKTRNEDDWNDYST